MTGVWEMLKSEQFLFKQITKILTDAKHSEAEARTAANHAIQYRQAHPRTDIPMLISEAKRHAKQIHRPEAPSVKRQIQSARLPKWKSA